MGFNLLWHGDLAEAEAELQVALDMAEQIGDISLQARCLAYLAVVHRRQGHDAEVEAFARRGLAVAEAAGMLDYLGASQAGLAWVAWRRGDTSPLLCAAWSKPNGWRWPRWRPGGATAMPYPFYWQALWPLIGVALAQERPADAIAYARRLHDPSQQLLPAELAALTAPLWTPGMPGRPMPHAITSAAPSTWRSKRISPDFPSNAP